MLRKPITVKEINTFFSLICLLRKQGWRTSKLNSEFIVSWKATSNEALDKITPVNPPTVNQAKNPIAQINGVVNLKDPPYIVAIQEKILIPVGTAIIIVTLVKYALVSQSNPTLNM